ncbi:MAG: 2-oxoglutarate dehydrogenase [Tenericutes bacterium HGW-Tenericutes-1]|nr:MAG: 2-oxoglutarate dehydrogenase [Tenericutes bacterium HGW-Tenericutes-1]
MFGFRNDGKRIKTIDPVMRLVPHIMPERSDAQVWSVLDINCEQLDNFIFEKRKLGDRYSYMHLLIAAIIRVLALRPKLNRFIMNGRIYKRNDIQVSLAVKKSLTDAADETTIKLTFKGTETVSEIRDMIDKEVVTNAKGAVVNGTDKTAKILTMVPNFIIKMAVGFLKFLDKHGLLPKGILNVSPFHTSVFITNMKSIKMGYVVHHIYNFGTTSLFLGMGKESYEPIVKDAESESIGIAKIMKVGAIIDERICDGLYNANSLREFKRVIENPHLLETPLDKKVEDQK